MDRSEWLGWWPAVSGALVLIGGAIAWLTRTRRQHGTDQEKRQQAREKAVTTNTDRTFRNATDLIDQYQEDFKEKRVELAEIRAQCQAELAELRARADEVERRLLERIGSLERQVATLQNDLRAAVIPPP